MTKVLFETATLSDALARAERCAPKIAAGDHASDVAAGIMIDVDPASRQARIRSTNLEVRFSEWIPILEAEGDAISWRVPSARFTGVVKAYPQGTGKQIMLENVNLELMVSSGASRSKILLMLPYGYPEWEAFSRDVATSPVNRIGENIGLVSWACLDNSPPFNGILFTGDYLLACSRISAALVMCKMPAFADNPVTVPVKVLGPVLKDRDSVRVGIVDNMMRITPDHVSQIECQTFAQNLPTPKFLQHQYANCIRLQRDLFIETLKRLLNITNGNKDEVPTIRMFIGNGRVDVSMHTDSSEWISDSIELTEGQANHDVIELQFVSKVLIESITKCPGTNLLFSYDAVGSKNAIIRVDAENQGYMAFFVQKRTDAAK